MDINQRAISATANITGTLSLLGSIWIIHEVVSDKKKLETAYHRLVLVSSVFDALVSFWLALSSIPMPKGSWYGSRGNFTTCEIQGFFIVLGAVPPVYTAIISLYFLLSIRYGFREKQLAALEKWVHPIVTAVFVSFAITGIFLDIYNPLLGACAITTYPLPCGFNTGVECLRGRNDKFFAWIFVFGWIWLAIGVSVTSLLLVYLKVIYTETRTSRYRYSIALRQSSRRQQEMAAAVGAAIIDDEIRTQENFCKRAMKVVWKNCRRLEQNSNEMRTRINKKKSTQVAKTSLGYVAAFLITWVPIMLFVTFLESLPSIRANPQGISILIAATNPLQGFLNFLVYMRPRYQRYMNKHPEWSTLVLLRNVLVRSFQRNVEDGDFKLGNCVGSSLRKSSSKFPSQDKRKSDEENIGGRP